jgi:hypothetical protein
MGSDEKSTNASAIWNRTMKTTKTATRYVICVNNDEYPASLELFKIYRAIPDKKAQADGDVRVIDESSEDYLFPADYFIPINLPRTIVRVLNKSFMQTPATA